jgi:pilus assembly protein Flp/PilA
LLQGLQKAEYLSSGRKEGQVRKLAALRHKGQGLVEYGLILVLIMVVITIVLLLVGNQISDMFSVIASNLDYVMP